jgi:hypothetical protein
MAPLSHLKSPDLSFQRADVFTDGGRSKVSADSASALAIFGRVKKQLKSRVQSLIPSIKILEKKGPMNISWSACRGQKTLRMHQKERRLPT